MSPLRISPFLLMLLIVLGGCSSSPDENAANENQNVEDSNQIDGHYIEYYPNGSKKVLGQNVNGKKDGLWKYFYEQKPLKASLKLYSLDTLKGIGEIKWNDSTYKTIDRKEMTFYYPDDTVIRVWGFNEKGIKTYYSSLWKKAKSDSIILLKANGDTAGFTVVKNGKFIKSASRK